MKRVVLLLFLLLVLSATPAHAMFGFARVTILPRLGGYSASTEASVRVTVYQPLPTTLAPAVDEGGTVASGATAAAIYLDRFCTLSMANPQTVSESGGPLDGSWTGSPHTDFSFFCNWSEVSLLVVMPDGRRFGIPRVQVQQLEPSTRLDLSGADSTSWLNGLDFAGSSGFDRRTLWPGIALSTSTANDYMNAYLLLPQGQSAIDQFGNDGLAETTAHYSWDRAWVLDVNMIYQSGSGTLGANTRTGVALGVIPVSGAVMGTNGTAPAYACYFTPTSSSNGTWSFFAEKGSATGTTVSISQVPAVALDQSVHVTIVYVPLAYSTAGYAACYIGGIEVARVGSKWLQSNTASGVGYFGVDLFVFSGSGANTSVHEIFTAPTLRCYGKL